MPEGESDMRVSRSILVSLSMTVSIVSICLVLFSASWMRASAAAPLDPKQQINQQDDPTLTLTRTVGTDPAACAPTNEVRVLPGLPVYECLTVTNSTDISLTVYAVVGSTEISLPVAMGQTVIVTSSQAVGGRFVFTPTAPTVSTSMHQAVGIDVTGADRSISGTAVTKVDVIGTQTAHIAFAHTVSTDPEECSAADSLEVEPSTQVYSCFTAFNRTSAPITMTLLTLPDHYYYDASGELPDAFSPLPPSIRELAAGESVRINRLSFTATHTINTFATISYETNSGTSAKATALALVRVDTGLIHLPLMFASAE